MADAPAKPAGFPGKKKSADPVTFVAFLRALEWHMVSKNFVGAGDLHRDSPLGADADVMIAGQTRLVTGLGLTPEQVVELVQSLGLWLDGVPVLKAPYPKLIAWLEWLYDEEAWLDPGVVFHYDSALFDDQDDRGLSQDSLDATETIMEFEDRGGNIRIPGHHNDMLLYVDRLAIYVMCKVARDDLEEQLALVDDDFESVAAAEFIALYGDNPGWIEVLDRFDRLPAYLYVMLTDEQAQALVDEVPEGFESQVTAEVAVFLKEAEARAALKKKRKQDRAAAAQRKKSADAGAKSDEPSADEAEAGPAPDAA